MNKTLSLATGRKGKGGQELKKIILFLTLVVLSVLVRSAIAQEVAPDFILNDIDGTEFCLSDYMGKAVLLDFFATWCVPCLDEIPHLKSLHEEFGEKLVIITISVSPETDTAEKLNQTRQEHKIDWVIARDTIGISDEYGVYLIPTLVIIDQEGYIQHQHIGLTYESVLQEEISQIIPILVGDVNGDGIVDIYDIVTVAAGPTFGSEIGDPWWDPDCDLNNDNAVDIYDVVLVAINFGKTA